YHRRVGEPVGSPACLVDAGDQARPGGAADRRGDVRVVVDAAVGSQSIQVRGRHRRIGAPEAEVSEAVVIGDDQDDIGRPVGSDRLVPLGLTQLSLLLERVPTGHHAVTVSGASALGPRASGIGHRSDGQAPTAAWAGWPLSKYSRSSGASAGTS